MRQLSGLLLALVLVACVDDGADTLEPYDRAPVPAVPDRTTAVDPATIADGDYWAEATAVGSGRPIIVFELMQAFFGDGCIAELGADACEDDYGVLREPSVTISVLWDSLQSVTVVAENRQNYAVPGAELASLIGGNEPSADAPADYHYVPYPFLVTVRNGAIVEAHQIWLP